MISNRFRICFIAAAMFVITSCALFRPPGRSPAPLDLPEAYTLYVAHDPGPGRWWTAFGSAELDRLVDEALCGNFDIKTAWSRLKQADAVARQAGAALGPTLDISAGGEKSWQQTKNSDGDTRNTTTRTYHSGLAAAYEVDLWGRLNALRQSEVLELAAAREDLDAAAVSISAEVAAAWIDILSIRRRTAILREQIKINQSLLKLQELRFVNGKADALDVSQQREALAAAKSGLPMLQLQERQQLNALAVLLGRSSAHDLAVDQQTLPELIPVPGTGLPAGLLAARPDVRAAGLRLQAADWQVSAARANRLPSVTLTADGIFSSDAWDLLFSNWVAALAGSITGPLFDAGYRSAEVDRARAVAEENLSDYARAVAEAIQEVEDCLAAEKRQREYIDLLADQLKAGRTTLKDARLQYFNGKDNYLDYLTAWSSVQALERQMVAEQAALIKNRVALYRSLGGDWTRKLVTDTARENPARPLEKTVTPPADPRSLITG